MSQDVLFISDQILKERTAIHGNIDPKLMYPDIKVAQDKFIHPLLGTALFDKLQTLISGGTIGDAPNANYKLLLDRYIIDALLYYVLSELPMTLSYQFWNKGVLRKQGQDTELPSMSELADIAKKHQNNAEFYADRLKRYLIQNAAEKFPEYLNPGNGVDTINPTGAAFTMSVYLGPDDDCPCDGFNNQPYRE